MIEEALAVNSFIPLVIINCVVQLIIQVRKVLRRTVVGSNG